MQIVPTVSLQQIASPVTSDLHSICFISPSNAFISGANGNIYKTNNGGGSWTNISLSDKTTNVKKVLFISQLKGFCITQQDIFRTLDGGTTWISVLNNTDNIADIQFVTTNIGYAIGGQDPSAVYKTTNGGTTWNNIYAAPSLQFNAVSFINKDTGYATGNVNQDQTVFETTDGGLTWKSFMYANGSLNGNYTFTDLAFTGYRAGYVTGQDGFIESTGLSSYYGNNDQLISNSYYFYYINAVACRNGHAVAVGEYSILMPYKDPDSNFEWHYFLSPEGTTLPYTYNDVAFSDDFTYYAVGNGGVITKFKYPN